MSAGWEDGKSTKYYRTNMSLTIRDGHIDNHFNHVCYFINGERRKLRLNIFIAFFILSKFYIFIFQRHIYQQIIHLKIKLIIYPKIIE